MSDNTNIDTVPTVSHRDTIWLDITVAFTAVTYPTTAAVFSHFYFPASGQAVVTGVVPSPPRFLPSIFIAHRVLQSHCSSIFHRVLLTHALALSASQFVHKKESLRIYTNMHLKGLELTKLTYTMLEDNLICHRGDRIQSSLICAHAVLSLKNSSEQRVHELRSWVNATNKHMPSPRTQKVVLCIGWIDGNIFCEEPTRTYTLVLWYVLSEQAAWDERRTNYGWMPWYSGRRPVIQYKQYMYIMNKKLRKHAQRSPPAEYYVNGKWNTE